MSGGNLLFVIVGAIALIAGIVMIAMAIHGGVDQSPRNRMMLIGGMMTAAFGLVLGGFALVYATTAPLDYNGDAA